MESQKVGRRQIYSRRGRSVDVEDLLFEDPVQHEIRVDGDVQVGMKQR